MWVCVLKAKLHHARVTGVFLEYEGSLTLDPELMEAVGFLPYEQVHVYNVSNGERFITYLMPGARGRREVVVNGAAARRAAPGDRLIIAVYGFLKPEEVRDHCPVVALLGEGNQILAVKKGQN